MTSKRSSYDSSTTSVVYEKAIKYEFAVSLRDGSFADFTGYDFLRPSLC